MNLGLVRSLLLVAAALAGGRSRSLRGQEALYVQNGPGVSPVVAAREGVPLILQDGQLIGAPTHRYALKKVPEYNPAFVEIKGFRVVQSSIDDGAEAKNNQLEFYGSFVSPYALPHTFLVLEVHTEREPRMLFIREIGNLIPHKSEDLLLVIPIRGNLGEGNYKVHVFSDGHEVLHSQMPWEFREHVLDAMVAKRTTGAPDRGPQPFIGPPPEYPRALRKAKVSGRAVVRIHIDERGRPLNPVVASATDPAFGAAAVEAIRQWRFLPPIQGGVPTSIDVNVPFGFKP